jgi:hypothetical protein
MKKIASLIICLFICLTALAQNDPDVELETSDLAYHPILSRMYVPVQFAGNIGLVSAGIGYRPLRDKYQLSLLYGYTPSSVSAVTCHLITAKNNFHIYQFHVSDTRTFIPYAAIGISLEVSGRSFFRQPDVMPDSYYDFPKSLHAIPSLGVKLRHKSLKLKGFYATEFFAEASTVDAYIWYKFQSNDVEVRDIVSLALGVHLLCR